MNRSAIVYVLTLGFLFGSNTLISRFCVGQFNANTYIAMRLALQAFGFALIYVLQIQGRRLPKDKSLWRHGFWMGIFYDILPFGLYVTALQYLSAGVVTILFSLYPVSVVVMAHFTLPEERLNKQKIIGLVLALSGAVLMAALGESGLKGVVRANPLGYLLMLVSVVTGAGATIYVRKHIISYDVVDMTSVRMFFAALIMFPLAIMISGFDLSGVQVSGFTFFIISSIIGFTVSLLNFYIIRRFGASTSSMADYFNLVVASVGGVLFLSEQITWGIFAGMVLVLTGVIIVNRIDEYPGGPQAQTTEKFIG